MTTTPCCEKCIGAEVETGRPVELNCRYGEKGCPFGCHTRTDDWTLSKTPTFQQGGSSVEVILEKVDEQVGGALRALGGEGDAVISKIQS